MSAKKIISELKTFADPKKAAYFPRFFKTAKGQYGEGDQFIGVTVPSLKSVAKKYHSLPFNEIKELLYSKVHEHRLIALFILVQEYEKGDKTKMEDVYLFYYKHRAQVNNWDLVDSSAYKIMGPYLKDKEKTVLYELAVSKSLWDRRIAMMSTLAYIRKNDFEDALKIAEILVNDSHDLIQKAVGWMLREIGRKDIQAEIRFLDRYFKTMPRTMLRYAIERFDKKKKAYYMDK